jgi:hypothetical protein
MRISRDKQLAVCYILRVPEYDAGATAHKEHLPMTDTRRQEIEMLIAGKLVRTLLAAGFQISVWDGEAYGIKGSSTAADIIKALRTTDVDVLYCRKDVNGTITSGCVSLVYGNDGYDVISDNSCSLESVLEPVTAYAETFDK